MTIKKAAVSGPFLCLRGRHSVGFLSLALAGLGMLLGEHAIDAEQLFPPFVQQGIGVVLGRVEIPLEEIQILGRQFGEQPLAAKQEFHALPVVFQTEQAAVGSQHASLESG